MVKFYKNGMLFAVADEPRWVRLQKNGCYGLCEKSNAEGVAIDGTVYNLPGHAISENDEIGFEVVDGGVYMAERFIETEQMMTDLDIANIEAQQAITDLELMILEG